MNCARCNELLEPQAQFCPQCGYQVERPSDSTQTQPTYDVSRYNQYSQPDGQGQGNPAGPPPTQPGAGYQPPSQGNAGYQQPGQPVPPGFYNNQPNPSQPAGGYSQQGQGQARVAPLVLGIIGIVFAILLPIITYPCSIVGLVMANTDIQRGRATKSTYRTLNIVALVIAVCNSVAGVMLGLSVL